MNSALPGYLVIGSKTPASELSELQARTRSSARDPGLLRFSGIELLKAALRP
jgi:hypothetical protein